MWCFMDLADIRRLFKRGIHGHGAIFQGHVRVGEERFLSGGVWCPEQKLDTDLSRLALLQLDQ